MRLYIKMSQDILKEDTRLSVTEFSCSHQHKLSFITSLNGRVLNTFFWRDCSQDGSRREARKSWTGRSSSARGRTRSGSGSWRSSDSRLSPRNASASNARKSDEDVSTSSDRVTTTGLLLRIREDYSYDYFNEEFNPIHIPKNRI